ncbi:hypothetical protein OAF54_00020 [bacterium]|nr:hypothetical protein [bacterium]
MAINTVSNLDIGNFLKIFSTKGVYNNLSEQSELWKMMEKKRVAKPEGREVRYLLRKGYGFSAFQMLDPGNEGAFPAAQRTEQEEATAYFKDFATTIDVPRHLLNKTGSELAAYADPLAEELDAKGIATARGLSRQLCADGSSSLGYVSGTPTISGGKIVVTLNTASANAGRSHVDWFQYGEKVVVVDDDKTARTVNGGSTAAYFKVFSVDSDNDTVTLQAFTSADVAITVSSHDIVTQDYIFPILDGSQTSISSLIPDLSAYTLGTTEEGTHSAALCGLESLISDSGALVNGLTLSGAISGSRTDASGDTIDRTHFQAALSKAKKRVGKGKYSWKEALMNDNTYDAMMESWETDRMIVSTSDTNRGAKQLGYQHGKDVVAFTPDEFVQKSRIWMCPEGDVLQYRGTSIDQVDVGGQKFFMPSNSSSADRHQRAVRSYLEGSGLLFCVHPAAVAVIENFAV